MLKNISSSTIRCGHVFYVELGVIIMKPKRNGNSYYNSTYFNKVEFADSKIFPC